MAQEGTVQKVNIEGLPSIFIRNDLVEEISNKTPYNHTIKLLSPFDNSIIHRDRIKQIFDFDFRLECYTPKEKRQYGYFCLPILFGDTFIGRVDCKAHRTEKKLELVHLSIEGASTDSELWIEPFIEAAYSFAAFNDCHSVVLTKVSPSKFTDKIKQLIEAKNWNNIGKNIMQPQLKDI